KHKARSERMSLVDSISFMAAQASKPLQKADRVPCLEDKVIDIEIESNIHRSSAHEDVFSIRCAPLFPVCQSRIFPNRDPARLEILFQSSIQAASSRHRIYQHRSLRAFMCFEKRLYIFQVRLNPCLSRHILANLMQIQLTRLQNAVISRLRRRTITSLNPPVSQTTSF